MTEERKIQKILAWTKEVAQQLEENGRPPEGLVRFVPVSHRSLVSKRLQTAYGIIITEWGSLVNADAFHPDCSFCQSVKVKYLPTQKNPNIDDENEEDEEIVRSHDMFPLLLAFFMILGLLGFNIWMN